MFEDLNNLMVRVYRVNQFVPIAYAEISSTN